MPSQFLLNLVQLAAKEESINPKTVLLGTGVGLADIQNQSHRATFDEQVRVYERIAEVSNVPGIGFRSPSATSFADQGLLGALLILAPSVGIAFEKLGTYGDMMGALSAYELSTTKTQALVRTRAKYRGSTSMHRMVCEENLAIWKYTSLPMAGLENYLQRIDLDYPRPKHWSMYTQLFPNCNFRFDQRHVQAVLAHNALHLKMPSHNPDAFHYIEAECKAILRRLTPKFKHLIQQQLIESKPTSWNAAVLADAIGTSERTLRRRLREEGVTLQETIDRHRYHLFEQLQALNKPKHDIAKAIGLAPASLGRAYANWRKNYGQTGERQ